VRGLWRPAHAVVVAINVMPEIHEPAPPPGGELQVRRRRGVELILRPGDLVIGRDAFLERTLQVHLSRDDAGRVVVNLYGGGITQAGLDEINHAIHDELLVLSRSS